MKKLLVVAALGAMSLALVSTAFANHSWGRYHWARTTNPLTLKIGDNVSSTWDALLGTAVSDWDKSGVLTLTPVGGTAGSTCAPTAGRIEVCSGAYGATGWLGIAQIWTQRRGHIYQATTKVNDTYHNSPPYNTTAWRQLVICQEIGHDFGLDHQDENFNNANLNTCMDYTSSPDSNQHPNQHDYDQLASMYGHLDSTNTASAGTPSGLPGNAPPFSQASRAKGSVYVDHLPGGVTRLTHVFWTPDGS